MKNKKPFMFATALAAVAFVTVPVGNGIALAKGVDNIITPEVIQCEPSWAYSKTSTAYTMQWYKKAEGTHYINQTASSMSYTSQLTASATQSYSVSGSVDGGFGPINASLGFTANTSITLTTSDSTTITIPSKYEGWNDYGTKRDSYTGWYYYENSDCSQSNGHYVTTITPRVKAVVGRTKYVGTM